MWILDKLLATLFPLETVETRQEARRKALATATPGDWLSEVLRHHQQIEAAFRKIVEASTANARTSAHQRLVDILTAHSIAEEAVIYPALAEVADEADATTACVEQASARLQMGRLTRCAPMSDAYLKGSNTSGWRSRRLPDFE